MRRHEAGEEAGPTSRGPSWNGRYAPSSAPDSAGGPALSFSSGVPGWCVRDSDRLFVHVVRPRLHAEAGLHECAGGSHPLRGMLLERHGPAVTLFHLLRMIPQSASVSSSAEPASRACSATGIAGTASSPAGFSPVKGAPSPERRTRTTVSKNQRSVTSCASRSNVRALAARLNASRTSGSPSDPPGASGRVTTATGLRPGPRRRSLEVSRRRGMAWPIPQRSRGGRPL